MWQITASRHLDKLLVTLSYYDAERALGERWQQLAQVLTPESQESVEGSADELAAVGEELLNMAYGGWLIPHIPTGRP